MRNTKLSLLLIISSLFTFVSCNNETSSSSFNSLSQNETTSENVNTVTQKVKLTSFNEYEMNNVTIELYKDSELVSKGITTNNGVAYIEVPSYDEYEIKLNNGFKLDNTYYTSSTGEDVLVNCTTSIIQEEMPEDFYYYEIGNLVYDFTYTESSTNEDKTISSLLGDKKALVINFFFCTCKYCLLEFPFMEEAYQLYKDDVEILAISDRDSHQQVSALKNNEMLTFDMTVNGLLPFFFPVNLWPTTFIIDRYGIISYKTTDYLKSVDDFTNMINPYLSDDYKPSQLNLY